MSARGFTLVELLVVVAIIGVLSTIGITVFTGARQSAQQAKIKADLDAIRKAYDSSYNPITNKYRVLTPADFSGGEIPKRPDGTSYSSVAGPGSTDTSALPVGSSYSTGEVYKVCVPLAGNTSNTCSSPSTNCACVQSPQGDQTASTAINATNHPSSCDPNGTLGTGLVGYWTMNESSWNGTSGEVKDSSPNGNNGTARGTDPGTTTGKYGNAGNFSGSNHNYINTGSFSQWDSSTLTISFWMKGSFSGSYQFLYGTSNYWTNGFMSMRNSQSPSECSNNNGLIIYHGADQKSVCNYLTADTWTLFTITYNNTTKSAVVYKNGQQFTQFSFIGNIVRGSAKPVTIAARDSVTNWFTGQIDDFRVYNRALSPAEVSSLYNNSNGCVP